MTGPAENGDDRVLWVTPGTRQRLVGQERAAVHEIEGHAVFILGDRDPRYPGRTLEITPEVMDNSVHVRRWNAYDRRYIFEYAGDI